jgi:YVTN family beta-propeller protein
MIQLRSLLSRWLLTLLSSLVLAGCGNEFRPVAIPIIPPGGTPQAQKHAIVISKAANTGTPRAGTSTNINVAGDTVFTLRPAGTNPVHAAMTTNQSRTFVANQDDDTLTSYVTFGTLPASGNGTIVTTLPLGSEPVFVHTREPNNMYVALKGSSFDPTCGTKGAVGVIAIATLTLSSIVCAGEQPVALAELPNGSKLYVVNQLSGNVTVINTADRSLATPNPIAVGPMPSWIDVSADGKLVFVANSGTNTVTVIDAATDIAIKDVTVGTSPTPSPTFLRFDASRKRVYVANSVENSVSIIDAADPTSATYLTSVATVPVGPTPKSLTVLANGTKVYVTNSGVGANSVSVIDAATNTVTATIAVGTTPVWIDSSPDSAQVFVANQGTADVSGNVSVIRTSDNAKLADIALPAAPGSPGGTVVNPNFLLVTP